MVFWALKRSLFQFYFLGLKQYVFPDAANNDPGAMELFGRDLQQKTLGAPFTSVDRPLSKRKWLALGCAFLFGSTSCFPRRFPLSGFISQTFIKTLKLGTLFWNKPSWWSEPKEPLWKTLEMKLGNIPKELGTVDGRNPAPPGRVKTL